MGMQLLLSTITVVAIVPIQLNKSFVHELRYHVKVSTAYQRIYYVNVVCPFAEIH